MTVLRALPFVLGFLAGVSPAGRRFSTMERKLDGPSFTFSKMTSGSTHRDSVGVIKPGQEAKSKTDSPWDLTRGISQHHE